MPLTSVEWNYPGDWVGGWGAIGYLPVVGDWDGDGVDQIGVYHLFPPGFGRWVLDDGNGYWNEGDVVHYFGGPDDVPVVGDWDGM